MLTEGAFRNYHHFHIHIYDLFWNTSFLWIIWKCPFVSFPCAQIIVTYYSFLHCYMYEEKGFHSVHPSNINCIIGTRNESGQINVHSFQQHFLWMWQAIRPYLSHVSYFKFRIIILYFVRDTFGDEIFIWKCAAPEADFVEYDREAEHVPGLCTSLRWIGPTQ